MKPTASLLRRGKHLDHSENMIIFLQNTALLLQVKNSYMLRLAKVAIIRLNRKKIKRKINRGNEYATELRPEGRHLRNTFSSRNSYVSHQPSTKHADQQSPTYLLSIAFSEA
jgi:hypothetical protein